MHLENLEPEVRGSDLSNVSFGLNATLRCSRCGVVTEIRTRGYPLRGQAGRDIPPWRMVQFEVVELVIARACGSCHVVSAVSQDELVKFLDNVYETVDSEWLNARLCKIPAMAS